MAFKRYIVLLFLGIGIALTSFGQTDWRHKSYPKLMGGQITPAVDFPGIQIYLFLSPECPLCKSYAPVLKSKAVKYASNKFYWIAVFPGTFYSPAEIKKYTQKYGLNFSAILDNEKEITQSLSATITPEVVVCNQNGKILYQGRIDNWAWSLSNKRAKITQHDLDDALTQIQSGLPVTNPKTTAVGCIIE